LNATPKSLWKLFEHKAEDEHAAGRLRSVLSTKAGKHGSVTSNTEVPRRTLVTELKKESDLFNTQDMAKAEVGHDIVIAFGGALAAPASKRVPRAPVAKKRGGK
jgi:hypothetical protein